MYVNVDCGICGSCINIDSEWEESSWMMLFRFADAHVDCGTFTPPIPLPTRIEITEVDDEDEEDADEDESGDEA